MLGARTATLWTSAILLFFACEKESPGELFGRIKPCRFASSDPVRAGSIQDLKYCPMGILRICLERQGQGELNSAFSSNLMSLSAGFPEASLRRETP